MRQVPVCNYEAMFLFPQSVSADLKSGVDLIKDVLTKNGATIIAIKKWGDRPLAYPIQKQKRGLYILVYFSVSTDKLGEIERAFNLSELVIRQLLLRADHLTMEEMVNAEGQADLTIEANLRAAANEPAPTTGAAPTGVSTTSAAPKAAAPAADTAGAAR